MNAPEKDNIFLAQLNKILFGQTGIFSPERVHYALKDVLGFSAEFDKNHSVQLPVFWKHDAVSGILKKHLLTGFNNPFGNSIEIEGGTGNE